MHSILLEAGTEMSEFTIGKTESHFASNDISQDPPSCSFISLPSSQRHCYNVRYKSSCYTKLVAEDNFITKESLMVETGGRGCIEKQYTPPQIHSLRNIVFEWNEKAHLFSSGLHFALVCFSKFSAPFDQSKFLALHLRNMPRCRTT
jgi:hypothetical protein